MQAPGTSLKREIDSETLTAHVHSEKSETEKTIEGRTDIFSNIHLNVQSSQCPVGRLAPNLHTDVRLNFYRETYFTNKIKQQR